MEPFNQTCNKYLTGFARLMLTHGLTEVVCGKALREGGINAGSSRDARDLTQCLSAS